MKWIDRADCRPPNRSSSQGQAAFSAGDMVRPVRIISGISPKITSDIGQLLEDVERAGFSGSWNAQRGMLAQVVDQVPRLQLGGAPAGRAGNAG